MRRRFWPGMLIACLFSLFPEVVQARTASPLGPDHFSATIESSFQGRSIVSRFYRSGQKIRMEPDLGGPMGRTYEILLPASGTMTVVFPDRHLCMKKAVPAETRAQMQPWLSPAGHSSDLKDLGPGHLDGHPVEKRLLTVRKGAPGGPVTVEFWNATDLDNVPLKEVVTMADGSMYTVLYKKIDLSTPSPALFVPPADCTAFPDVGSMLNNFLNQKGQPPR